MPLYFNTEEAKIAFATKLKLVMTVNKDLKALVDKQKNTDALFRDTSFKNEFEKTTAFLQEKWDAEVLEYEGKQGPATVLMLYIRKIKEFTDSIAEAAYGAVPEKQQKAWDEAELFLDEFMDEDRKPSFKDSLDDYYKKYGYTESAREEFKLINGMFSSIKSIIQIVKDEKRKATVNEAQGELLDLLTVQSEHDKNVRKLITVSHKLGIPYENIKSEYDRRTKEIQNLEGEIAELENSKKYKDFLEEKNNEIKSLKTEIDKIDESVKPLRNEFQNLEELKNWVKGKKIEIDGAEPIAKTGEYSLRNLNSQIASLNAQKEREIRGSKEYDKSKNDLNAFVKFKQNKEVIKEYESFQIRMDKLHNAQEKMIKFFQYHSDDIGKLIRWRKNGEDLGVVLGDYLDLYEEAKKELIDNFSVNKQDNALKDIIENLENEVINEPEEKGYISKRKSFLERYFEKTHLLIPTKINELGEEKEKYYNEHKAIIDPYNALKEKIREKENSAQKVKDIEARIKKISNEEIPGLKKKTEKSIEVVRSFREEIKKNPLFKDMDDSELTFDKIMKTISGRQQQLKTDVEAITNDEKFQGLKQRHQDAIKEYNNSTKNVRSTQANEKAVILEDKKKEYKFVKRLYEKQNELENEMISISERGNRLQESINDLKDDDCFMDITRKLRYVASHILYKSKNPDKPSMSDKFRDFYNKLNQVSEIMNDDKIKKEVKLVNLVELGELTDKYIEEKESQYRPRLFASEQRFVRLNFAKEIQSYIPVAREMVEHFSDADKRVNKFLNAKQSVITKENKDKAFAKELEKGKNYLIKEKSYITAIDHAFLKKDDSAKNIKEAEKVLFGK